MATSGAVNYRRIRMIRRGIRLHKVVDRTLPFLGRNARDAFVRRLRRWSNPAEHRDRGDAVLVPWIGGTTIDRALAYRKYSAGALPHQADAVACCQRLFDDWERDVGALAPKKEFLVSMAGRKELESCPAVMRLALSNDILSTATAYLGELPVLSAVSLWWTPPNATCESSQRFHRDSEDDEQLKFFFNVWEVDESSGPLRFLTRDMSRKAIADLGYTVGRVDDHRLADLGLLDQLLAATGEPGAGLCIDSSSCLHYGSRGNEKPRLALMLQYTRANAAKADVPDWDLANPLIDELSDVQLQVLGLKRQA